MQVIQELFCVEKVMQSPYPLTTNHKINSNIEELKMLMDR
jgi:hypothetical protein